MRWVFVRPHGASAYYDPEIQEPLGVEMLSAARRARGDAVLVLDTTLSRADEAVLARRVAAFDPDAVGFSLTTALEVPCATALRARTETALAGRGVRWLAGGNFVSTEPETAAAMLPPDMTLVRFEGERALDRLALAWTAGIEVDRIVCGEAADIETLPFADRVFASQVLGAGWAFSIQGSRGCRGACTYCASPGLRPRDAPRWRGRPPEHLVEEMSLLASRYGARAFNFVDEDFLGPNAGALARAGRLADEIARRRLRVSFGIQARPDSLSPQIATLLARAGLTYAFLGLESDAPEDLRSWGRPPLEDAFDLIDALRALGVHVHVGTLLFHAQATLASVERFARALARRGLFDFLAANNRLDAIPGSALYRQAVSQGAIDASIPGPQALPFDDAAVAALHSDVVTALAPLGPPWMHAMCSLPPLLARARIEGQAPQALAPLRSSLASLDRSIAEAFFALLSSRKAGQESRGLVAELRSRHLDEACVVIRSLVAAGLAPSFEALREAVRRDAGL
jgi:hypothetical protein